MTGRCESCKWWAEPIKIYKTSVCRRNPPAVLAVTAETVWPETDSQDWCGEYQKREN